jgi:hypothetical protein
MCGECVKRRENWILVNESIQRIGDTVYLMAKLNKYGHSRVNTNLPIR